MASDNLSSLSTSLLLAEDPGVGFIKHELDEWDVIAVEAGGFVPDVTLAKQTDDGDGVADAGACLLAPDADSDQAFAKFMNWERCHLVCLCIDRAVNGMTSFGSSGWGCVFVGFDIRASEEVIQLCGKISERCSFGLSEASVVGNHRRQNLNQLDEVDFITSSAIHLVSHSEEKEAWRAITLSIPFEAANHDRPAIPQQLHC